MKISYLFAGVASGFMDDEYIFEVMNPMITIGSGDALTKTFHDSMIELYRDKHGSALSPCLIAQIRGNELLIDARVVESMLYGSGLVPIDKEDKSFMVRQNDSPFCVEFKYADMTEQCGFEYYAFSVSLGDTGWLRLDDTVWDAIPDVVKRFIFTTYPY